MFPFYFIVNDNNPDNNDDDNDPVSCKNKKMAEFEKYSPLYTLRRKTLGEGGGKGCQTGNWELRTTFFATPISPLSNVDYGFCFSEFEF